jgi:hypothetical protein
MTGELTNRELAGLLIEGIEACGLDGAAELNRIDNLSPAEGVTVIDDDQLAAVAVRMDRLSGGDDRR